ncbi:uncharacterized protein LOC111041515 [Myzus persicae]|uniref:uncharacterized protein LOC111041515 n=1 Tax=Myzus persicae TaxID=13164 RepID=UPI000B939E89|nr:uncharacterized protein LOC111041515 [Myzus persicae]
MRQHQQPFIPQTASTYQQPATSDPTAATYLQQPATSAPTATPKQQSNKMKIKCLICHKIGHRATECRNRLRQEPRRKWFTSTFKNSNKNMLQAWQAERDIADADPVGVLPWPITMRFVADAYGDTTCPPQMKSRLCSLVMTVVCQETLIWSSTTRIQSTRNTECKIYLRARVTRIRCCSRAGKAVGISG